MADGLVDNGESGRRRGKAAVLKPKGAQEQDTGPTPEGGKEDGGPSKAESKKQKAEMVSRGDITNHWDIGQR
jgi:hypothetical protein